MKRISVLDGWRGVAILLVLAEHAGWEHHEHSTWAGLGSLGVDIFFVLSGYIITARLLEERQTTSTIRLSSFYLRRAFRILPVVGCYLAALCVLSLFLPMEIRPSQLAASLLFFRNYQYAAHPNGVYTAQFWSLSIEEHFYLIWPLLLLRLGNRRALWTAGIGAALCGLWRFYDITHPNGPIGRWLPGSATGLRTLRTDARLDGLLLGCALAILLTHPAVRIWIARNFPKETPLLCATLLVVNEQRINACAAFTDYLLITLMIASTLLVKEGIAYKWLNSRILVSIGTISYSLYIWQQLFLLHPPAAHPLGVLGEFPANLICVFTVSACSYHFLEKPISHAVKRLARINAYKADGMSPVTEMLPT